MHIFLSIHWKPTLENSIFWTFDTADFICDKDLARWEIKRVDGSEVKCKIVDEYKSR